MQQNFDGEGQSNIRPTSSLIAFGLQKTYRCRRELNFVGFISYSDDGPVDYLNYYYCNSLE